MLIIPATIEDTSTILELQRLAYRSEAQIYSDFTIPPLTQTLDELKADFTAKVFLKAVVNGEIVGSVQGHEEAQTCYIERLIVHPAFQGQGIGTQLVNCAESFFPDATRFELFTGHKSEKNICLYQKLGYTIFKQEPVTENLTFVFMEKKR